jgi:hypothetical protein
LPQILQATTANAPRRMAPPTPTTTPIMVFFCDDERPELPEPPLSPFRPGAPLEVALLAEAEALLVMTREIVLLPLTVTRVVVTTGAVSSLVGAAVVVVRAV